MINEEKVREDWKRLDEENVAEVLRLLKGHEESIQEYLADYVASLCGVDKHAMMTEMHRIDLLQARWLFWYAYRYMTGETFPKIGEISGRYGRTFPDTTVSGCVNKMGGLINCITIWSKRWNILKRIIKLRGKDDDTDKVKVVVTTPKNVEVELKRQ